MSEWVRRDYRLPPKDVPVLARIDLEDEPPFIMEGVANWVACMFYVRGGDMCFYFDEITHWMPLPEQPEEEPKFSLCSFRN